MWATRFANMVLVGGIVFAALILAYVFQGHERFLTSFGRTAFFLGLPGATLIFLLTAFRLKPSSRLVAALLVLSVGASLYGFELFLAVAPMSKPSILADESFDRRTKFQVSMDLRKEGVDAYPSVFPGNILQTRIDGSMMSPLRVAGAEVLPLGGIANAVTVYCNENGRYETYQADEFGFHNPKGLWEYERLDLVVVGDSFAQGYCVPSEKIFINLLRGRFPRIVNLSMSGNGPLLELAALREFTPGLRPEKVLWFFYEGNDLLGNLDIERRSLLLMRYLEEDFRQGLRAKAGKLDAAYREYIDALYRARPDIAATHAGTLQWMISFIGLTGLRKALGMRKPHGKPDFGLFRRILARASRQVSSFGGMLYFVYLPASLRFMTDNPDRDDLDSVREGTLAVVRELELPLIDVAKLFAGQEDPLSLYANRGVGHYNEAGHALVAEKVLEALEW